MDRFVPLGFKSYRCHKKLSHRVDTTCVVIKWYLLDSSTLGFRPDVAEWLATYCGAFRAEKNADDDLGLLFDSEADALAFSLRWVV